jgi:hypothetical protein
LTTHRDKRSFILVCKETSIVGTPLLYKHMAVPVKALDEDFESTLSVPQNHLGLAHIRTLCVGGGINDAEYFHWSARDISALHCLLSALQENVLERFRYMRSASSAREQSMRPVLTFSKAFRHARMIFGVALSITYFIKHNAASRTFSTSHKVAT